MQIMTVFLHLMTVYKKNKEGLSVSCRMGSLYPFYKDLLIDTFTHCCKEDTNVQLKAEETRMFLNSKDSERQKK